ncbi:hypothetical protein BDV25DRAFT_145497 [Aspergillus avenaceus]|uniref:Major facilitator superfamily domain-containing protein n=1 Tax=Aspergillus avenaceus TaxID=36643 RepID=A0A5N6TE38_ASPAV|nr:hypothetical protein BDV25DRAFT_145497 [Aspergillus avenaceus]
MAIRPLIRRARAVFHRMSADETARPVTDRATEESKQDPITTNVVPHIGAEDQQPDIPSEDVQHGVRDVEAVTLTWSKTTLMAVFINIWFLYFVNAFQSSVFYSLSAYVSSSFQSHSLSGLPTALADAFSAAVFLPVAKLMDTWGPLNRGLAYAFTSSPYIITAFAGSKVADEFYYQVSWRWGLGCWAIIFPIVAAPLYFMLKFNLRKAEKEGHRRKEKSGRTFLQSIWYWFLEFDLIGVVMFTAGLVVFELPFDIASEAPNGWGTGYIIAMLVVGFSMLFFFAIYEKWIALTPLLNFSFLTDRTVIGACLLDATYQLSYYCWNNYFTSFLQVVNGLTIAEAGYVSNTFDVVSGVLLLGVGWTIRRTGRFKWLLYIAVPLYIFAQGLMIYFRKPNMSVGYQVMCQIFISIGGAIFIIVEQLAILAAVDHQHVAAALALLNVVGTIGDSAGLTICTAIWTNTYEKALVRYLPVSALNNLENIYEDITVQTSYPIGSATRLAIQKAYAYAEVRMLSAGLGVMVLAFAWTIMIKDIDLKKVAQVKGTVF